jgi:hypothetical protein
MQTDNPDFQLVSNAFPMFGANIRRQWGTKEFVTYMKELIRDARMGASTGFPQDVLIALMRLSDLHDKEYPHLLPRVDNNPDFKVVNDAFPRIGQKLNAFWGRREFTPYMNELLHDNRGGNRKGFPFETLIALHALAEQHHKTYAHLFPEDDVWDTN